MRFAAGAALAAALLPAVPASAPAQEFEAGENICLPTLRRWLEVFVLRFFETSQFKRSAMPNGPKVGSGGSLSPRSDWRAPSDSPATVWLAELRDNVPSRRGGRRNR